ncbi:MAG: hypothetical protein U1A27_12180 [Phycisphaerae bacterium]
MSKFVCIISGPLFVVGGLTVSHALAEKPNAQSQSAAPTNPPGTPPSGVCVPCLEQIRHMHAGGQSTAASGAASVKGVKPITGKVPAAGQTAQYVRVEEVTRGTSQTASAPHVGRVISPGVVKGFNPQPDPPMGHGGRVVSPGVIKGFNPQPDLPVGHVSRQVLVHVKCPHCNQVIDVLTTVP